MALLLIITGCSNDQNPQGSINYDKLPEYAEAYEDPNERNDSENILTLSSKNNSEEQSFYNLETQNQIQENINELKKSNHSGDQPLLVLNPFGTITNGLYTYFTDEEMEYVEYEVTTEGYEDFIRKPQNYGNENEFEFLILGLIPGETSNLTINGYNNENEKITTYETTISMEDVQGEHHTNQMTITADENSKILSEGLYVSMGNSGDHAGYSFLFDNNGVVRAELETDGQRLENIVRLNDEEFLIAVDRSKIVSINGLGKVERVFEFPGHDKHHDFIVTNDQTGILVLTSDVGANTLEDTIVYIDMETGEVSKLIDLKDILPGYFGPVYENYLDRAEAEKELFKEAVEQGEKSPSTEYLNEDGEINPLDWIHVNSIDIRNNDELILSGRENSSIIKLSNVFEEPMIDYIIADPEIWEGTGYEDLLLSPIEDFPYQAGQHTVNFVQETIDNPNEYDITMFNNNYWRMNTRPEYEGETLENTHTAEEYSAELNSYYYKYRVNEAEQTVELIDQFSVPYSSIVSSAQLYNDNIIINSGRAKTLGEYDTEGNLIREFNYDVSDWGYRVFKVDFTDFFFAE